MRHPIRLGRATAVLLLLALLLAACGQTSTGAPTAAPTAAEATAAPTAAAATAAEPTSIPEPTSAAGGGGGPIKIGSKDFGEQFILGEMYALLLEDAGFEVERNLNLGGTPVAHAALLNGDIDIYPEYTSTGLLTVLRLEQINDAQEIINTVREQYEQQFQLTWLDPAPFNNTQALAMTRPVAEQHGVATYSDLATKAGDLTIGGPAEFQEREDGLPGLQGAYGGFTFKSYVQLGTGSLRYQALQSGQVDVVVAFGTDGPIAANDLLVLEDDKGFYPIYQVAPVVRIDTLQANPEIATTLNKLAPLLTDDVMQGLNLRVDVEGQDFAEVAKTFLLENQLIQE